MTILNGGDGVLLWSRLQACSLPTIKHLGSLSSSLMKPTVHGHPSRLIHVILVGNENPSEFPRLVESFVLDPGVLSLLMATMKL